LRSPSGGWPSCAMAVRVTNVRRQELPIPAKKPTKRGTYFLSRGLTFKRKAIDLDERKKTNNLKKAQIP